ANYARLINLFAAVTIAAAAGLWFHIGERWLRPIVPPPAPPWARRLAAAAGALVAATGFTVWNQSVVNEKVYTVSVLSIALVLWLVVRWADQTPPPETRRDHHLVPIVYLLALTATNHLMGVLVAPAVLVYVLATDPRARVAVRRPRPAWRPAPLARGAPGRARHDDAAPDPHARVGVLPQFPVGLLPALPGRRARARGARAGLLLHRLVRVVGDLGGDGTRRRDGVDRAGPGCAPARGRPALGAGDAGAAARARPARRQPAHRFPGGRDHGARLRSRRAAIGGPLRARRDGGRQRHVPAVVRAGGRGRTPGRERPRALARQHRLVPAPAAAPAARDVRFAGRARVVSDAPLAAPADAVDGPLLPGGSGRLAPGLRGAVAAGDRATRTHRRR